MFKHMLWFLFAGPIAFIQFAVSSEAPCSAGARYPELLRGEIPLYPPIARSAHITGTVVIEVTVERGSVTGARLTSESNPYLANPSLANVKAWQFQPEDRTTFLVEYVYQIRGEETLLPENPRVELDLPCRVKVTASPFKPTETYGSTDSNA
ncbi:MAG: energy transducer TonB, partial [Acidobacteriota bacterium]